MDNKTVWGLTYEDFEMILGRELTKDEKEIVRSKFTIEDWVDHVQLFLDLRGIQ